MEVACLSTLLLVVVVVVLLRGGHATNLCDGACSVGDAADLPICVADELANRTRLPVMTFLPCNVPDFRGRGISVAAEMAVEMINSNESILPEYLFELNVNVTSCDRLASIRSFIGQLMERDTEIRYMIIGPGCSTGALLIAETAPFYSLTQISYTATSISLSDTALYPTFLRTISSDNASIAAIGALIGEYGWEQVAIITSLNELFTILSATMEASFSERGINVIREGLSFTPGTTSTRDIVERLSATTARIVILNVFESFAREIFCSAYRLRLVYPQYVFISYYWYSVFWWTDPITMGEGYLYTPDNCTVSELTDAIFRSLAITYLPIPTPEEEDRPSDVGYTPNEFWAMFVSHLNILGYPRSEALTDAIYTYDAVWAAALALNNASETLQALPQPRQLTEFTYESEDINSIILQAALNLDFQGVSGRVVFNQFGDREPVVQIYQYRFVEEVNVNKTELPLPFAFVDNSTGRLKYTANESEATVFPNGVPQAAEELFIHVALFTVYTVLCLLGVAFAVACVVFNLVFRKKRIVQLSSPDLSVLIILGAILFYTFVILFGIDENIASFTVVDGLCQARVWIASIAFSLFFGTILAKTFRVYYIFREVRLKQKPIKDWVLFLIVAVLIGIDLVFLIIVTPVWRPRLTRKLLFRSDGQIPYAIDECVSDEADIWVPVLLAYKAIILFVAIFLAIQTFKVKIKELNDSQLIFFSVMSIAAVSIVVGVISFLVDDNPTALYALTGFFIMAIITGILILLYATRMVALYRDPSGEVDLTSVPTEFQSVHRKATLRSRAATDDSAKITELKSTVSSLKWQISAVKARSGAAMLNADTGSDGHSRRGSSRVGFELKELESNGRRSQNDTAQNSSI